MIIIVIIIMVFQMGCLHCLTKRQHPNNAEFKAWLSPRSASLFVISTVTDITDFSAGQQYRHFWYC